MSTANKPARRSWHQGFHVGWAKVDGKNEQVVRFPSRDRAQEVADRSYEEGFVCAIARDGNSWFFYYCGKR